MRAHWLSRTIHPSWLIAWASLGIVIGIAGVGFVSPIWIGSFGWLCVGFVLILSSLWHRRSWMVAVVFFGGCLIGMYRGHVTQVNLIGYQRLMMDGVVAIEGRVDDDVETDSRGRTVVRMSEVAHQGADLPGNVWVTLRHDGPIRRSDRITVRGEIDEGFGSFAASMHDAELTRLKREVPGDVALGVRDRFAAGTAHAIDEPEASLGLGYLLGIRRGLPDTLDEALLAAGLTHIVVASGYNLTILARMARRMFERLSKYLAFVAAGSLIISFIAITGMSPSMSRAGLVAGLALVAWYYGRRFHPLVLLPLAMAVTVLLQPHYAWGDVGWQLSFAAFAGVMLLAPLLKAYFFGSADTHPLQRILLETVAAQLCTLPILLVTFGSFSVVAPFANLIILPLVPLAMLFTFIAGLVGLFLPAIGPIAGLPAQWLLTYMTQTIQWVGGVDWAVQAVTINFVGLIVCYSILVTAGVWMWRTTRLDLASTSLVE